MAIGILALQGDVREHVAAFTALNVATVAVKRAGDLASLDGVVLPGGESTTLSLLLESSGLRTPLGAALAEGMPAFGTCAGLVLLATTVLDGRPDQRTYGVLDCTVRRNGYGRQRRSFETTLPGGIPAVFIRAPKVVTVGPGVEIVAELPVATGSDPVALRSGPVLACAFHPELTEDRRFHRLFAEMAGCVPQSACHTALETALTVVMP